MKDCFFFVTIDTPLPYFLFIRKPSTEPVIGIGDMVSVSVWEAGSGGLFSGPLVADRFSAGSKSALIPEQPVGRDGAAGGRSAWPDRSRACGSWT